MSNKNFIPSLEELLKNHPEGIEDLGSIFDLHLKFDEKDLIYHNLTQHFYDLFSEKSFVVEYYLHSSEYINPEDVSHFSKECLKSLESLNKIKRKYGAFFKEMNAENDYPFLINGIYTEITTKGLHSIKIARADGECLKGQFSSDSLLWMIYLLMEAFFKVEENEAFSIDKFNTENILEISEKFYEILKNKSLKEE